MGWLLGFLIKMLSQTGSHLAEKKLNFNRMCRVQSMTQPSLSIYPQPKLVGLGKMQPISTRPQSALDTGSPVRVTHNFEGAWKGSMP